MITFPQHPVLSCQMALRFAAFMRDIADPLAKGIFGQTLNSVATGPGYECRTRNHQPNAKISSHGQGNAIDIAQLVLADGRKIAVERPGDAASRQLLAGIRAAACGTFSTVLGPGSDAAHATHMHVDIEARGRDGLSKFCQ